MRRDLRRILQFDLIAEISGSRSREHQNPRNISRFTGRESIGEGSNKDCGKFELDYLKIQDYMGWVSA